MLKHYVVLHLHKGYVEMYVDKYYFIEPIKNAPLCSNVVALISCSLPAKSESVMLARIPTQSIV